MENPNPNLQQALGILARQPRNFGAHLQAGVLYSQDEKWEKSAFHLKKALANDKRNALILEKLVDVSIKARQPLKARKYARQLMEARGRDATAMHAMARAYEGLRDMQQASHWIDLALQQEPKNARLLVDKANYHSIAGDLDAAVGTHRKILELYPQSTHSWWPLAQLQKFSGDEAKDAIEKIEKAIAICDHDGDMRGLHFAAGKIHQDIASYGAAFEHFEAANNLYEDTPGPDRIIACNINIHETYSREFLQDQAEAGHKTFQPIFILGQPRSGTTLTESLCGSHSKISAGGEISLLSDYNKRLEIFSTFENRHKGKVYGLKRKGISNLAKDFVTKTRHLSEPGTRLTDKLPHNYLCIGLINMLFPHAKIIHCRRHPMDNCLSIYTNPMMDFHKEYKSQLDVLGVYYNNYAQIMDYWKEISPIEIHDVFYEDLVTNTEAVARRMIDYLGEDWEDGVMDRSGSKQAVKTLSAWQVRQPVFQTSKGKWRNYEQQLKPLSAAIGDYVEKYDAELVAADAVDAGGAKQA